MSTLKVPHVYLFHHHGISTVYSTVVNWPLNHYFALLVVLTFITNAPRLNNMYFIINGFVFLHKSDLIPFIVELSPYISGTAVVSYLETSQKEDMFSRCQIYKPGSFLFLLGEAYHLQGACMNCTSKQPLYNGTGTI